MGSSKTHGDRAQERPRNRHVGGGAWPGEPAGRDSRCFGKSVSLESEAGGLGRREGQQDLPRPDQRTPGLPRFPPAPLSPLERQTGSHGSPRLVPWHELQFPANVPGFSFAIC